MAKVKKAFFCKNCGFEAPKWLGRCPSCGEWNTFTEEIIARESGSVAANAAGPLPAAKPQRVGDIRESEHRRIDVGNGEVNRVLGGGMVPGSLILVGGEPGIGKSTLSLQIALAANGLKTLYVSGEESVYQIKLRADRLGVTSPTLTLMSQTDVQAICEYININKPGLVIIDSIQTMYNEEVSSAPGSVSQVRESTGVLLQIAKGLGVSVFIVGHVTKDGNVAGPRVLEHMVDTVLYFEGDRHASYRILRGVKNRFGSTNEIGVFEMREEGLAEVPNPSEFMLEGRPAEASGAVTACSMEGTRPILLEVQALVSKTNFGLPRRTAAGVDYNRVNLLMAVLEKRCRYALSGYDAYVNIAGGMKMNEPALDLAIVMALISSYKDRPLDEKTIVFGEVGLSGEVRAVSMAEQRVHEAVKMGFTRCILPMVNVSKLKPRSDIRLEGVANVREAIGLL